MQLQQLRYLIAAAEYGSFRAAAQKLYVSQSSLSVAIKDLEQETGTTIFNRTSRGITLTNEGVELLGYAKQIIEQADLMLSRYSRDRAAETRFAVSSQHYSFVVEAFGDFIDAHDSEAYDFQLHETYTNEVISDVSEGRSEVGIIYLSNYNDRVITHALDSANLAFTSLFVAQPHVFVGAEHPMAGRTLVEPQELAAMTRYEHEQGIESSSYYSEEPLSTIPCKRRITLSDNGTLARLLSSHDGYTIATGVFPTTSGIVPVPLDTDEIMNVGLIARTGAEPSGLRQEFLRLLATRIMRYTDTIEPSSATFDLVKTPAQTGQ